ncbi:MAG TPA: alpha/beta hydrolase [Solirubrobacteraceae bacterium]|jgi:3-oxoadipate enol-lactonase|nr:alpha/beta hydrolase [Solirubrobacteraceae bacterium]
MPLARVGEIELSYERTGSGPPLLLIMGMSGTFSHWPEPFLDQLRASFEVIVYDHRGVGESSPRGDEPVTTAGLAADAAGLLDALELGAVDVLGISMGGMVAQELVLAHPERVGALVLGCTYCGGPDSALASPEVIQRLAAGMSSGDRELSIRTAWEINASPAFVASAEGQREWETFRAIGMRRAVPVPTIMAQMRAVVGHDTHARLGQLAMPTLIVHGTADQMVPVENAHLIHRLIPGSRLEILDGAGHLFFWEQPHRSAELVLDHLAVHA